ncbi:hypothetical protein B0H13DRAFT_1854972 [Mycena leptocephala]|nr:hypothetical protein B0H13DRAFT_1854972 [Mycena leptocephala]
MFRDPRSLSSPPSTTSILSLDVSKKSPIGRHIPTLQYCVHTRKFAAAPAARSGIVRQWFIPVDVAWEFSIGPKQGSRNITALCREGNLCQSGFEMGSEEVGAGYWLVRGLGHEVGWGSKNKGRENYNIREFPKR